MIRSILAAAALAASLGVAQAQTANASPTSGIGAGSGSVSRMAPSGSTAIPDPGQSQVGAPTPLERHEDGESRKDAASVCKGC